MKPPNHLQLKNNLNLAKWQWRWCKQGGSIHWHARPLQDLRNEEDLRRYRMIQLLRRHTPFGRRVVNLAAFKFEREWQKALQKRRAMS